MRWLIAMAAMVVMAASSHAQTVDGDWMGLRWGDIPAKVAASKVLTEVTVLDRSPQPKDEAETASLNGVVLVTAKYLAISHTWDTEFGFLNGRLFSVTLKDSSDAGDAALDSLVALYGAPSLQTSSSDRQVFRWRDLPSKNFILCTVDAGGRTSITYRPLAAASVSGL